jgi:vancomycin resistance protein VanJ
MEARPGARGAGAATGPGHAAARANPQLALEPRQPGGDFLPWLGLLIPVLLGRAQDVAGDGFGFTWPASFPVVRIDQILVSGVEPDSSWVLPANGSDHKPVEARISW